MNVHEDCERIFDNDMEQKRWFPKKSTLIVGGGLVGTFAALHLAHHGISSTIIDKADPAIILQPSHDGRTTSVALGVKHLFDEIGIWKDIAPHAAPINEIKVFELGSAWAVHYDHNEIGPDPLGYIVENYFLRTALYKGINNSDLVTLIAPSDVKEIHHEPQSVTLTLEDQSQHKGSVLIGADGRLSSIREESHLKSHSWSYHQTGLVCHVYHEKPHRDIAWEVFTPTGPFAILPMMPCSETGRHRSGIVWSLPNNAVKRIEALTNEELGLELSQLFDFYGTLEVIGQRWMFPLSAMFVRKFIGNRIVLIGDAAHGVHPIAGQGVNLGWRDAAVLAKKMARGIELGLDVGGASFLESYQKERMPDLLSILGVTDGVTRLFSNNSTVLGFLRNAGLGAVNTIPPLKKFFMRKAMGIT